MKYRLLVDPASKLALRVEALLKKGWSVFGDPVYVGGWASKNGHAVGGEFMEDEGASPLMAQAVVLLSPSKGKVSALTSVGDKR